MQVNETIRTCDLAEALRGEHGKFEVLTTQGVRLIVTTLPGHSIAHLCVCNEAGVEQMIWVKKVADFQEHYTPQFKSQIA
jgi:hypothetical protein